tara:strand:- start:219 stop:2192 length:1974 start_codon:yes stop_codon:yes gene_type:complete
MLNNIKKYFINDYSIILTSIFILISPVIIDYRISDMILSIRYMVISFLILLLSLSQLKKGFNVKLFKQPIIICLIGFLLINIISSVFNGLSADSIFFNYKIFVFLLLTFFFSNAFGQNSILIISKSVLIFSLLLIIIYFLQFFNAINNDIPTNFLQKTASTLGNKNLLASILLLTFPFIFFVFNFSTINWKVISYTVFLLIVLCLFIIQSKVSLIAFSCLIFSFFFFSYKTQKKSLSYLILSVIVVCTMLFLVSPNTLNKFQNEFDQLVRKKNRIQQDRVIQNDSRILLYKKTIKMIKNNPLIGIGPGNWRIHISKFGLNNTLGQKGDKFVQRPHSDFLWFFAEGGFFSFALYLFLFVLLLRYSFLLFCSNKTKIRLFYLSIFSTILAYVIISSFDFPSERPLHNFLFSILSAILISEIIKEKNPKYFRGKVFSLFLISSCVLTFIYSILIYNSNLHMSNVLKFKSHNKWKKMVVELNSAYHPFFFDIDNTSTPLYWYYGLAYYNMNDIQKAFSFFEKAYEKNPYHLHVINNLATCYGFYNNYSKAEGLYKECQFISPRFEEAALNLSNIYFYNNEYENAFDILLKIRDFKADSYKDLSKVYLQYFNKVYKKLKLKYKKRNTNDTFYKFTRDNNSFLKIKNIHNKREKNYSFKEILN